ncbi:alpha-N-acetylglucosaminidase [Mucilaginibacter pineti]|uniref:Alpha-N-acetylglucosaminidase n=2 Tax=Mucilaginibacter pineti TaxID=1391627 RepID=A0A1G7CY33_9SPHI|nr:alpha-N-acetylglucosaminidase [Mucilaginibacter pineti]
MISFSVQGQDFTPVRQLAQRRVPWLAPKLVFFMLATDNGKDVFEISTKDNKVRIAASNANTAATALNWYLKYYCHRSMSHMGDNLSPVAVLPLLKNKVRIVAEFPVRYALNYCTISYTMAFYKWNDWERELDWMALNGVNLMLAPVGTEAVWENTLKRIGYSDKEALGFIPGPGFTAWWLMGNLEGWGGPVTQIMIDRQTALQRQILSRMKQLGISPILQAFYGVVPTSLKNKMNVQVVDQGNWVGGFKRPDFLLPTDTSFKKIAGIYYEEMQKLYGKDIHYFGGEPFHEGGKSAGIDITASAKEIQHVMQQYYPASTWVLQGWQENPSKSLLQGLDRSKALVIELFGENTNNWEQRNGYDSTSFVWSNVSNFGEKNGLYGKLQRFASEVYRAKNSKYGNLLKGVGVIPEGIRNNPVAYDLMLELGWHKDSVDVSKWIKGYVKYRYGTNNDTIQNAWQQLLQTVYSSPEQYQEGPSESIFCARPAVRINSVSSWGTRVRNYDLKQFEAAVKLFVSVSPGFENSETYKTDRVDFLRQLMANRADTVYATMIKALKSNNKVLFNTTSDQFCHMLMMQDSLLSSNKYFSLSTWLNAAERFGITPQEKIIALQNAKAQITYWGGNNPKTDLRDYAHKEWGGLLSSLYVERWKRFIKDTNADQLKPKGNVYFDMEKKWADSPGVYQQGQLPEDKLNDLINRIIK